MSEISWHEEVRSRFHCDHDALQPTRKINAAGAMVVVLQCKRCGKHVRQAKKTEHDLERLPWFDKALQAQWAHEYSQAWEQARQERNADRQEEVDAQAALWWREYNRYLDSDEWRSLRAKVLLRDNYLCQGCLVNRATQAHHISYEMYNATGHSMAYELKAICKECHDKIHPEMREGA